MVLDLKYPQNIKYMDTTIVSKIKLIKRFKETQNI